MNANKKIFFWLDLEMTGLGDDQFIIEIASAITDDDLNIIAEGPEIAILRSDEELSNSSIISSKLIDLNNPSLFLSTILILIFLLHIIFRVGA